MSAEAGFLRLDGVSKRFGALTVVEDLDLRIGRGELVTLLGPSGCGKTTLLRLVAGLVVADKGRISLGGRDLTRVPPHRRNLGVVFQNYALFPHLTVAQNVGFGLKARGVATAEIRSTVDRQLAMVRMSELADRPVTLLSGGQQQRVAVARALAVQPDLVLLDEPFSALDRKLREQLQVELKQLLRGLGITAIFVTHDQEEALVMSDRMAVMNGGRIEQFAEPEAIYGSPASLFVLEFVGMSTRLTGRVIARADGEVSVETPLGLLRARGDLAPGAVATVGVRPEHVLVGEAPGADEVGLRARLVDATHLGSRRLLRFDAAGAGEVVAEVPAALQPPAPGTEMALRWPLGMSLAFPAEGSARD